MRIGPDTGVLFGAVFTAEDGEISVGARSVVMQNAVIRGRERQPSVIGDDNPTLIVTIWPARKMAG